jgi:transcriptional regulator with XRE-family HTH domain
MPTTEQREAFAEALQQALHESRISGRALARDLGISQAAVAQWLRGETAPRPARAAQVERLLGCDRGSLTKLLGFVAVDEDADGKPRASIAEAVEAEARLGPREKSLLLAVYRELLKHYAPKG